MVCLGVLAKPGNAIAVMGRKDKQSLTLASPDHPFYALIGRLVAHIDAKNIEFGAQAAVAGVFLQRGAAKRKITCKRRRNSIVRRRTVVNDANVCSSRLHGQAMSAGNIIRDLSR